MGESFFRGIAEKLGLVDPTPRLERLPNDEGPQPDQSQSPRQIRRMQKKLERLPDQKSPLRTRRLDNEEAPAPANLVRRLERLPPTTHIKAEIATSDLAPSARRMLKLTNEGVVKERLEPVDPPERRMCRERGRPNPSDYQVYINADCCAELDRIAASSGDVQKEMGAYMFGRRIKNKKGEVTGVWVQGVVQGPGVGTAGGYNFNAEVVVSIFRQAESRADLKDTTVVGWFHTHPEMDTFLSHPDITLFKGIAANRKELVALVIAPHCTNRGMEEKTVGQFFILDDSVKTGYRALGGFFEVGTTKKTMRSNGGQGWKDVEEYRR